MFNSGMVLVKVAWSISLPLPVVYLSLRALVVLDHHSDHLVCYRKPKNCEKIPLAIWTWLCGFFDKTPRLEWDQKYKHCQFEIIPGVLLGLLLGISEDQKCRKIGSLFLGIVDDSPGNKWRSHFPEFLIPLIPRRMINKFRKSEQIFRNFWSSYSQEKAQLPKVFAWLLEWGTWKPSLSKFSSATLRFFRWIFDTSPSKTCGSKIKKKRKLNCWSSKHPLLIPPYGIVGSQNNTFPRKRDKVQHQQSSKMPRWHVLPIFDASLIISLRSDSTSLCGSRNGERQ